MTFGDVKEAFAKTGAGADAAADVASVRAAATSHPAASLCSGDPPRSRAMPWAFVDSRLGAQARSLFACSGRP